MLWSLYFVNLVIFGMVMGTAFEKQNPAAIHHLLIADTAKYEKSFSTTERTPVFLDKLKTVVQLTTACYIDQWRNSIDYLKTLTLFYRSNIHEAITFDNDIAVRNPKSDWVMNSTSNHELVLQSVADTSAKLTIATPLNRETKLPDLISINVGGRHDPFLNLPEIEQNNHQLKIAELNNNTKLSSIEEKLKPKLKLDVDAKPKDTEKLMGVHEESKSAVQLLNKFHLRGIVIGPPPIAYFEDKNGFHKVFIGDSLAGGQVLDITTTTVTVQFSGEQIKINAEE